MHSFQHRHLNVLLGMLRHGSWLVQVVQQALNRISQGRTTITIAHRLSTIWDSDSIAVVQSGCVLEQGSHQELAQIPGGAYASLLMSQQAGFALAK